MRAYSALLAVAGAVMLQGCIASTVLDVATLPVKVAGRAVDLATTSQAEADQKRGREIRQREERLAQFERQYQREMRDCQDGDRRACERASSTYAEMQRLIPQIPVEPEQPR